MADPRINIIVNAETGKAEAGLKKVQGAVQDIGKKGAEAGKVFEGISIGLMGINAAADIVTKGLAVLKKAFDFAKEGAAIAQTKASFDGLMASMGKGPDVLSKMREASRGTVDDLTLMKGTLTLAAGASDQLAKAMVGAAPQLMEIAKAANKLNPTLGDTAFMYDSLALGIKRSSPLILDNLGLTIKIGEANEKMARSLGKSVEQLTAEEQKMALLNATIDAGQVLIEQVGGNVDSMSDSFAQSEITIKNATDTLKTRFAPVMATVLDAIAGQVRAGSEWQGVLAGINATVYDSRTTYEQYTAALMAAAEKNGMLVGVTKEGQQAILDYAAGLTEGTPAIQEYAGYLGILTQEEYNQVQAALALDAAYGTTEARFTGMFTAAQKTAEQIIATGSGLAGFGAIAGAAAGGIDAATAAIGAAAVASAEFDARLALLHQAIQGPVAAAVTEFQSGLATLKEQLDSGAIGASEYKAGLDELSAAFTRNTNEIIYNIAEMQILDALENGLIEDTNKSGTAYDEASSKLMVLAQSLGLVDESTVALSQKVTQATTDMIAGSTGTKAWADDLSGLSGKMIETAGKTTNLSGNMGNLQEAQRMAGIKARELRFALQEIPNQKTVNVQSNAGEASSKISEIHAEVDALHGKTIQINVNYNQTGSPPAYQHGGQFQVRGPSGPDRVPVMFRATAGEVVTITPAGAAPPPNPAVNNSYNLTIHSSAPAERAVSDFNVMKALAGV